MLNQNPMHQTKYFCRFLKAQINSLTIRSHKNWAESKPTSNIYMPRTIEERKLPVMPPTPIVPPNVEMPVKHPRACIDMRGPEPIHNQLIYRQYGLIALGGGAMTAAHMNVISDRVNKYLDFERFFAVWRIDPPWKAVSKRSLGKRGGGGKSKVHHYETPIKAGRIIFEIGGIGLFEETERLLTNLSNKMPIYTMPISQEIMDKIEAEKVKMDAENFNPFEYRYLIRNNFSGALKKIDRWERRWGGTYF